MWIVAVYHQVSLFSYKPSDATSTGGRSLLIPTPFGVKMALLDCALRVYGKDAGSTYFPSIRDLAIALSPPYQIVVNNCFMRVHKPRRSKSAQDTAENDALDDEGTQDGPYIRSVAFREYVHYGGPLGLAVETRDQQTAEVMTGLLALVSYFGKRGSFFQIDGPPRILAQLPAREGYLRLNAEEPGEPSNVPGAVLQVLDDCTPKLTFEQANIYSGKPITAKERVSRNITLPYRLTHSSRGFSLYERVVM